MSSKIIKDIVLYCHKNDPDDCQLIIDIEQEELVSAMTWSCSICLFKGIRGDLAHTIKQFERLLDMLKEELRKEQNGLAKD